MPLYPDESSKQSDRGNENEKAKDGARRIRCADGKERHRNTNRQKNRVRHNGTSARYYAARGRHTQVVPRGEYQMDDSGMVINGTYHEFAGDEGKMYVVEDNPRADNGVHLVADNNGNRNRCVHCSYRRNIFLFLTAAACYKYIMSSVVSKV